MIRLQQCKPIQYSKKLLKDHAPLWELGLLIWNNLLTIQRHSNEDHTLHIQPTSVIMARLPNGDKPGPKSSLRKKEKRKNEIPYKEGYLKGHRYPRGVYSPRLEGWVSK
jgi:hypothetical protein